MKSLAECEKLPTAILSENISFDSCTKNPGLLRRTERLSTLIISRTAVIVKVCQSFRGPRKSSPVRWEAILGALKKRSRVKLAIGDFIFIVFRHRYVFLPRMLILQILYENDFRTQLD